MMLYSFGQICTSMLCPGMRTSSIFNTQTLATRHNRVAKRAQQVAPNNAAIRCVEVLQSFNRRLQILDQQCCDRLAGAS